MMEESPAVAWRPLSPSTMMGGAAAVADITYYPTLTPSVSVDISSANDTDICSNNNGHDEAQLSDNVFPCTELGSLLDLDYSSLCPPPANK